MITLAESVSVIQFFFLQIVPSRGRSPNSIGAGANTDHKEKTMSISEVTSATRIFRSGSDWPYRGSSEQPVIPSIIAAVAKAGPEFAKHIARRVRINADRHPFYRLA